MNEDALTKRGYAYEILDGEEVNITVKIEADSSDSTYKISKVYGFHFTAEYFIVCNSNFAGH